jgi:hypothetical protein
MSPLLRRHVPRLPFVAALPVGLLLAVTRCAPTPRHPDAPGMARAAPAMYRVRIETSKGPVLVEARREWAPHGADRFYNLVRAGYYDNSRFFRVVKHQWVQFGISGNPEIAALARPDDPRRSPHEIESPWNGRVRVRRAGRPHHTGVHQPPRQLQP